MGYRECNQLLHGRTGTVRLTVTWEERGEVLTNCYMGGREVKCDQLLHGSERYSEANHYMGGRGTVRLTVTWEGEVPRGHRLHGS